MKELDSNPQLIKEDLEYGVSVTAGTALGAMAAMLLLGKFEAVGLGWLASSLFAIYLPFSALIHRKRRLKSSEEIRENR